MCIFSNLWPSWRHPKFMSFELSQLFSETSYAASKRGPPRVADEKSDPAKSRCPSHPATRRFLGIAACSRKTHPRHHPPHHPHSLIFILIFIFIFFFFFSFFFFFFLLLQTALICTYLQPLHSHYMQQSI